MGVSRRFRTASRLGAPTRGAARFSMNKPFCPHRDPKTCAEVRRRPASSATLGKLVPSLLLLGFRGAGESPPCARRGHAWSWDSV